MVKEDLVKVLMANNCFTYREARKFVNALLGAMAKELKASGVLELPIGTMTVHHPKPRRAYRLGKIVRINTKSKIHFKKKAQ